MGYTTDFGGQFTLNRKLDLETFNLLKGLNTTRRMGRKGLDPKYGMEGEFYVADEDKGIIDSNTPPKTQPGLWCQWAPTEDGLHIEWDGGEKFYEYVAWLQYLLEKVLVPRGYVLNGTVEWQGEENEDFGEIWVQDNAISTRRGERTYGEPELVWEPEVPETKPTKKKGRKTKQ